MGVTPMMTAFLGANLLTAMCVYGFVLVTREERSGTGPSWAGIACILFPLAMFVLGMLSSGYLPTALDALAAR